MAVSESSTQVGRLAPGGGRRRSSKQWAVAVAAGTINVSDSQHQNANSRRKVGLREWTVPGGWRTACLDRGQQCEGNYVRRARGSEQGQVTSRGSLR
jgi:hypothetical protein